MNVVRTALARLNIANPLVAWLTYRGEMVASAQAHERAMSFWLLQALGQESRAGYRHARFDDELHLDTLRRTEQPQAVSRLGGFYLFDDEVAAERAIHEWGRSFHRDALAEVGIVEGSRSSRHDAEWITRGLGTGDRSWMGPYLRGEPSGDSPIWELVVDGRAIVFGTDLRKAAYDVVARTWPRSLALLELSRVAVDLGSDLGLILPMVLGQDGNRRVDFAMSFVDASDDEFLDRFDKYDGPVNRNDLRPDSDLVLPDLQSHGFDLRNEISL
jgi:hypothetical protein